MLWTCAVTPDPTDVLPPHLARAVGKEDLDSQRGAVQFAMEALQRQQSDAASPTGGWYLRLI
ncbi:hypothetical protein HPB48_016979 [Haemaphysalis longicornis]|uniref:Uncharacterized protein n=1 Tax=Haemaphysalis longicornis TaxID=44386 RepID=A0A9J6H176_HAELO|nr:hypothetical protein HPB48_011446 [Haemaphysalis longicornis]KAH9381466.1 hypothetical protein HPB48_016979 [Haemaphysalis longicornis]